MFSSHDRPLCFPVTICTIEENRNRQEAASRKGTKVTQSVGASITGYTQMVEVDASTGRNFRNVGNYASGYNAISVNMARIVGEMPNFAENMRIGVMAISNNIQPLAESIQQLNNKNKELAAQGQPTTSALEQVGDALFSWNTLMMVGVTALTVYGPKLIDWISNLSAAKRAAKALKEEEEALTVS